MGKDNLWIAANGEAALHRGGAPWVMSLTFPFDSAAFAIVAKK